MMRVLSVQSHVVHGYAGNKSSTFPLQLQGFDVDPINTCQLSNHTRYPSFKGERVKGSQIMDLVDGLEANGILSQYSHILSGYNSPDGLRAIGNIVKKIRAINPNVIYVMDTVLGDNGVLYCEKECIPLYREMCNVASMITPNQFEAEILTESKITDCSSAREALIKLHGFGVNIVIITSVDYNAKNLILYGSLKKDQKFSQFSIAFPKIEGLFTGTGDLFAALLLARASSQTESYDHLVDACEMALSTMHDVLIRTREKYLAAEASNNFNSMRDRELCLIQSKDVITSPRRLFKAVSINH